MSARLRRGWRAPAASAGRAELDRARCPSLARLFTRRYNQRPAWPPGAVARPSGAALSLRPSCCAAAAGPARRDRPPGAERRTNVRRLRSLRSRWRDGGEGQGGLLVETSHHGATVEACAIALQRAGAAR
jgi:hypothetical protein